MESVVKIDFAHLQAMLPREVRGHEIAGRELRKQRGLGPRPALGCACQRLQEGQGELVRRGLLEVDVHVVLQLVGVRVPVVCGTGRGCQVCGGDRHVSAGSHGVRVGSISGGPGRQGARPALGIVEEKSVCCDYSTEYCTSVHE